MYTVMDHEEAEHLRVIMQQAMPDAKLTLYDKEFNEKYPQQPACTWVGVWFQERCVVVINNLEEWEGFLALVAHIKQEVTQ